MYSFLMLCAQGHHWEKEKKILPKAGSPESSYMVSVREG